MRICVELILIKIFYLKEYLSFYGLRKIGMDGLQVGVEVPLGGHLVGGEADRDSMTVLKLSACTIESRHRYTKTRSIALYAITFSLPVLVGTTTCLNKNKIRKLS